jgi:hypothetical protein
VADEEMFEEDERYAEGGLKAWVDSHEWMYPTCVAERNLLSSSNRFHNYNSFIVIYEVVCMHFDFVTLVSSSPDNAKMVYEARGFGTARRDSRKFLETLFA